MSTYRGRHVRCVPDAAAYRGRPDLPCQVDGHADGVFPTWDLPSRAPKWWYGRSGELFGDAPKHLTDARRGY